MWGRFPWGDSDSRVALPGSSHHRDWPRPQEAGGLPRGSASSRGNQVASWRCTSSDNEEEVRRRSADHRRVPPPCLPSSTPTHLEALDFHGKTPPIYPHWCSLCDVTVMSEKVWFQHINGTPHADGQLQLLQRFPRWDCRLEPDSGATPLETGSGHRADSQSEHSREESATQRTANQSSTLPSKTKKKAVSRSSVVCVKFPPQAVDEVVLRRLAERFGPVIQVMMFPSLAFMELGSAQQAQDLVRFHQKEPLSVQEQQMEFTVSHTFSFPQSSRVVSFSPAPAAGCGLMALVRRFGSPLHILVQPTAVLVEMEKAADAQKLLNHFSSNSLKVNGEVVAVTFSREFRSLMRVAGALKCQEEEAEREGGSFSREPESNSRTWSRSSTESPSPGSHVAPAAPPAEGAEPEEDSDSSADSDIEGMQVIAANLEDDDLENMEEEEQEEDEMPQEVQEVDSPADMKNGCTAQDHLKEDAATVDLHEVTLLSCQTSQGLGDAAVAPSQREKRPHGPEESRRSPEEEEQQQWRRSPKTSCGSSEEATAGGGSAETSAAPEERCTTQRNSEEESAPPPDRSPDSTWIRSRRTAVAEEETLKRGASIWNQQEPEGKKRSCVTVKQELDHQQGATSTPELLTDPQSQEAEPEHQKPAQPVGTEFVRPVVGYFCHLCQVIYADEDEAKVQHCSSPAHYRKYQEKTGQDPWR